MLTRPNRARGESDHLWPEMLPGGQAVLFTITTVTGGLDAAQVAALDLATGTQKILVRGGSHAHYVNGVATLFTRPAGHCVPSHSISAGWNPVERRCLCCPDW